MVFEVIINLKSMSVSILMDMIVSLVVILCMHRSNILQQVKWPILLLFNMLILLFCCALLRMNLTVGAGLGLFALLAIIRFRSEVLKIEDMIAMLLLMGLGFLHATYPTVLEIWEILIADCVLLGISFSLTKKCVGFICFKIRISELELLNPSERQTLLRMLEDKIGLVPFNVKILNVNLEDGTANLSVKFYDKKQPVKQKSKYLVFPSYAKEITA